MPEDLVPNLRRHETDQEEVARVPNGYGKVLVITTSKLGFKRCKMYILYEDQDFYGETSLLEGDIEQLPKATWVAKEEILLDGRIEGLIVRPGEGKLLDDDGISYRISVKRSYDLLQRLLFRSCR